MENEIYERDYTQQGTSIPRKNPEKIDAFWSHILGEKEAEECSEIIKSIPKTINPTARKRFERMVVYLDTIAQQRGGKIKSVINYQDYYAEITVDLPFLEKTFQDSGNWTLLSILLSPDYLSVVPVGNDYLRLTLRTKNCFVDIIDEGRRKAMLNSGIINEPWLFQALYRDYDRLFGSADEE